MVWFFFMIKVSIFSFLIFGDFNELLTNSILLAAYIHTACKKVFLDDPPIFFVNHNSLQVQLSLVVFCSNILWLDCCRTLKTYLFDPFSFKFTCRIYKCGKILLAAFIYKSSNYGTCCVYKCGKILLAEFIYAASNYLPRIYMQQVITCGLYKPGKQLIPAFKTREDKRNSPITN